VFRRHDEVAFVLAILVIDDDHDFAASDRGDRIFHRSER
jgi:hypothetical protein